MAFLEDSLPCLLLRNNSVELHEGLRTAPAAPMDGAGDHFFARPRLAQQEHGGIRGRHGLDRLEDAAQRRTVPDDLRESAVAAAAPRSVRRRCSRRILA